MKYLYHVRVAPGLEYDCLGEDSLQLKEGEAVIVKCERYQDLGIILKCFEGQPVDEEQVQKRHVQTSKGRHVEGPRVPQILRRVTAVDQGKAHDNEVHSKSMHRDAMERIAAHGLGMKLINTHCSFDRRLVVFQFSAEGRVDFRELLRDLSHQFRTRVELRQVGVRDEAAIQGGIGSCGRPFCCATFLKRFSSINVKMAKQQGLSLNPTNISGACGRLKCCLQYEADWYRQQHAEDRARDDRESQCRGCAEEGGGRDCSRERHTGREPDGGAAPAGSRRERTVNTAADEGPANDDDGGGQRDGGAARPGATSGHNGSGDTDAHAEQGTQDSSTDSDKDGERRGTRGSRRPQRRSRGGRRRSRNSSPGTPQG